jgi:hypothetical protein
MKKSLGPAIEKEFEAATVRDRRLKDRLLQIAGGMAADPEQSFPSIFDDAGLEGAYRFFRNKRVTLGNVLAGHIGATIARCGTGKVIFAHDTTPFVYRAGGARKGLGSHFNTQQFFAHATLAVSSDSDREPLGVVAAETFVRKGDGGDGSEAARWARQALSAQKIDGLACEVVHVMDREADDYQTFAKLLAGNAHFVIRGDAKRLIEDDDSSVRSLRDALARFKATTQREVPLTVRTGVGRSAAEKKRYPPRNARPATLHIAGAALTLKRPMSAPKDLPPSLKLNVVRVWEPNPPPGETAVEWVLITTESIATEDELVEIVDMYRARWRIEEFFKALKTGCAFESRQLESRHALENALGVSLPIAWRLLNLRTLARTKSSAPARRVLDQDELAVLRAKARRPLPAAPNVMDVFLAIAALGGHQKQNGEPGWRTLARGLEKLIALTEGYRLAKAPLSRADSGTDQS